MGRLAIGIKTVLSFTSSVDLDSVQLLVSKTEIIIGPHRFVVRITYVNECEVFRTLSSK